MTSITLTPAAASQILNQITRHAGAIGLRVGIKPVGCSGFAYTYALAEDVRANEQRIEAHGATLLVANDELASLEGASLDFVTEGLKQSFQFNNPNVTNTCGCGESFSLKPVAGKGVPA